LKKSARQAMKENKISTVQELFAGSAYDSDLLWTRGSRELSKGLILFAFFLLVMGANLTLITAGFMVQVKLTGKPASAVISKTDAPGLEKK
jgi:hypothetical protein